MKSVTKFVSNDGYEFKAKSECEAHEILVGKLDDLFAILYPRPERSDFANGKGYIQHKGTDVKKVKDAFALLAIEYHGIKYPPFSYGFWRWLGDCNSVCNRYGYRLNCINEHTYREYGQPYYANNPDEVDGGRISK